MAQPRTKGRGAKRKGQLAPHTQPDIIAPMCSPVRLARTAAHLRQEDLERLSGLTQATISRIEHDPNASETVQLSTARALAAALGTTVDALFPPKGGA